MMNRPRQFSSSGWPRLWLLVACLGHGALACSDDVALDERPDALSPDAEVPQDDSDDPDQPDIDRDDEDTAVPTEDAAPEDTEGEGQDTDTPPVEDIAEMSDLAEDDVLVTDVVEDTSDVAQDVAPDEPDVLPPPPIYLVNAANNSNQLRLYDVDADRAVIACDFQEAINYPSITFGLDGTLYGSRNGQFLDIIDPCNCTTSFVGDMGYDGIVGITANGVKDIELYGLSRTEDLLLTIDLEDGAGNPVGDGLGIDFGFSGSTWSSDIIGLFAINSTTNTLYTIGPETGLATRPVALDTNFGTVGIEWHPSDRNLYACTDAAVYRVDPSNGQTTFLTRFDGGCNNLAAPWIRIQCLEDRLGE